ncbi:MAG: hypothetical protein KGR42_04195 [Acidobacteria bacterium]|nr:hypothetical protein [Acidobacteriota bacterium]
MTGDTTQVDLSRDECVRRLGAAELARVLISVRCLPTALPTRVRLVDQDLALLDSDDDAVVQAARRHDVLTVQVDGVDDGHPWSVVASGISSLAPLDPAASSPTHDHRLITLPLAVVVGQRH